MLSFVFILYFCAIKQVLFFLRVCFPVSGCRGLKPVSPDPISVVCVEGLCEIKVVFVEYCLLGLGYSLRVE